MNKEIIINSTNEETRLVIREDSNVVELFVEAPEHQRMVGDIYKGKVSLLLSELSTQNAAVLGASSLVWSNKEM